MEEVNYWRRHVKNIAYAQLIMGSMMIPCFFFWIFLPALREIRYVYIEGDGQKLYYGYPGEVIGRRILYPIVLVLHYFHILHASMRVIIATEKVPANDLKKLIYKVLSCLTQQSLIFATEFGQLTSFCVVAWTADGGVKGADMKGYWVILMMWIFTRCFLYSGLLDIMELGYHLPNEIAGMKCKGRK
ncbi:unnamed protein product [Orchesella dallaii]|uniref:Uncharacterized protein n=1 Tax=Orchesella dallaii TaxID=48710 RepID=A0ABP1PHP7_9HEXA